VRRSPLVYLLIRLMNSILNGKNQKKAARRRLES
jgi:hypothetical protein